MTDISQWLKFILEKQITRLSYYYLLQIQKYFIVYFDSLDINSCGKYLFANDSIRSKLSLLSNIKLKHLN